MFTNYFIKKKIQALVSDAGGRPHRSLSLDEARSLLVLYNIEDHEDVMRALEPLRKAKKDIKTCVYVPSGGADILDRYHPAGLLCLAIHRSPASIRLQGRD